MKIYDITGREIYTVVNERLNAGSYKVDWTSINYEGSDAASGVYFYKIVAGDYVEAKKMMLVR